MKIGNRLDRRRVCRRGAGWHSRIAIERIFDTAVGRLPCRGAQPPGGRRCLPAAKRLTDAFGETAGSIGILIALASIIGQLLLESGAARLIVDAMLRVTGTRFSAGALTVSPFVLGIPVFFDTVFYLMVPLARSLRERTGANYVLYI